MTWIVRVAGWLEGLLLKAWLGAVTFFAAFVAPALFRSLEAPDAGRVVRRLIPVLDAWAICAVALILFVTFVVADAAMSRLRLIALGVIALCAGASLFGITPLMTSLRVQAADQISALSADDPRRIQFGRLHAVSSTLMAIEWLLGLIAVGAGSSVRSDPPAPRPAAAP